MLEKIIPFIPKGGESARVERQWEAAGLERGDDEEIITPAVENLSTKEISFLWNQLRQQYGLVMSPVDAPVGAFDGVGQVAESSAEQVRLALIYHYQKMSNLSTPEALQHYWDTNPIISKYLGEVM